MAFVPTQLQNTGMYIPTTSVYDVSRLYEVDVQSPEFKELLVRLYQSVNNIALSLNNKDSALYQTQEFDNGQLFFNPNSTNILDSRNCFRMTINVGALPAGVTTVAHNIAPTNTYTFTRLYGVATDSIGLNYYPLPFAGAVGNNIELRANNVNIIITNNSGATFDRCIVVAEYLKTI
jgi:hypothetical protein